MLKLNENYGGHELFLNWNNLNTKLGKEQRSPEQSRI